MKRNLLEVKSGILAVCLASLFWISVASPLTLTNDSFLTLDQVFTSKFDDFNTVSFTLYVKLLSFDWHFPLFLALAQSALVIITLVLVMQFIFESKKLNLNSILIIAAILEFLPFFGAMGVTLWKDIPYSTLTTVGLILIFKIQDSINLTNFVVGFLCLGLGTSFRHDGWPTLILFILFLIIFLVLKKWYSKFAAVKIKSSLVYTLLIITLFTISLSTILVYITNAKRVDPWWSSASFIGDVAYVSTTQSSTLPDFINRQVASFATNDSRTGAAHCQSIADMVYSPGFDANNANLFRNTILTEYPKLLFGNAAIPLAKAHYCRTKSFILWPFSSGPSYEYWVVYGVPNTTYNTRHLQSHYLNLYLTSKAHSYIDLSNKLAGKLLWPGFLLSLTIIFFLSGSVFLGRFSNRIFLLLLFVVARHVVLVLFGIAQDFRYALVTYLICIPINIVLLKDFVTSLRKRRRIL